jgi:hypothetical protein
MKFSSIELNDSGFINLEIPIILFYNPAEWYVLGKKPGIELFLFSTRSDTNNIIFGTGYKSTSRDDTLYGEDLYDWHLLDGESRFRYNKYPLDFFDISPNDENRYSRSRDIKPVVDDTVPVIFQVVFLDSVKYYPIKLEYETYNFDPTGTYLLLESFEQDSKFNINMRDINILSNGRHQFIIDDTTIKTFYITYYKRRLSYVNNLSYTTEGFIIQQYNKIILKNFKHSDRIEIFNILGKKVFENDFDEQIDISDLQKGVYFINTGFEFVTFIKL